MRILIADDDRDAIMTLGILLRSEGHEVWSTQAGTDVPDVVREFRPEMVLLDVAMPERSGYELAEELSREYGNDCPVLVGLAGSDASADATRAEASGFQHLVAKPYDGEELLTFVSQFGR